MQQYGGMEDRMERLSEKELQRLYDLLDKVKDRMKRQRCGMRYSFWNQIVKNMTERSAEPIRINGAPGSF